MMKVTKPALYIGCFSAFVLLCSLSHCFKEDKTPGPETIVQGKIIDVKNNVGVGNIRLDIVKRYSLFLSGPQYTYQDSIRTNPDGSFYKKFIPEGTGVYTLDPYYKIGNYAQIYHAGQDTIKLGATTTINLAFMKTVKLTVHIQNKSYQNRANFNFNVDTITSFKGYIGLGSYYVVKDTTVNANIPQLSSLVLVSVFYNTSPAQGNPRIDTVYFRKKIFINRNDTTVNIVNP